MKKPKIGIIGEFYASFKPHSSLNQSLEWLQEKFDFDFEWIDTLQVLEHGNNILPQLDGVWSAPGSPFKSLEGALLAIKYARENNVPHLGTCAGLQHTIIEFARNVLGFKEAQHEGYESNSSELFISKLTFSLAGKTMQLELKEESLAYNCYQSSNSIEDYYCNFGINPDKLELLHHPLHKISGVDQENEIRIIEIPENDFFIATLFVPQSRSTKQNPHPIIKRFVETVCKNGVIRLQ